MPTSTFATPTTRSTLETGGFPSWSGGNRIRGSDTFDDMVMPASSAVPLPFDDRPLRSDRVASPSTVTVLVLEVDPENSRFLHVLFHWTEYSQLESVHVGLPPPVLPRLEDCGA